MTYIPKNPGLFSYSPEIVDPLLLEGDRSKIMKEVAEQIYMFRLFTSETCRALIEEAENCGNWRTEADEEENPYAPGVYDVSEADTTQHLYHMDPLQKVFGEVVNRHLKPLMESTWTTFRLKKGMEPYILRYGVKDIRAMALHHDLETLTLVVYLNEEFEGGGTHFPRWNYKTGKPKAGTAILYPGGLSHEHEGLPITAGTRYVLCASFY